MWVVTLGNAVSYAGIVACDCWGVAVADAGVLKNNPTFETAGFVAVAAVGFAGVGGGPVDAAGVAAPNDNAVVGWCAAAAAGAPKLNAPLLGAAAVAVGAVGGAGVAPKVKPDILDALRSLG